MNVICLNETHSTVKGEAEWAGTEWDGGGGVVGGVITAIRTAIMVEWRNFIFPVGCEKIQAEFAKSKSCIRSNCRHREIS